MASTARSVRCRKCHTGYDHHKHAACPRCGAPSKATTTSTPAVAGGPPPSRPKRERMTPLMKVASRGDMLVHGQPSILDPTKTTRREKRQANNTPILIGGVVGVVAIVGLLLAMGGGDEDKGKKKGASPPVQASQASGEGTPAPPPPGPVYQDPAKMAAQPPQVAPDPEPREPLDPLEAEARDRTQPPARPGPGPDGAAPPQPGGDPPRREPPPSRPPVEWHVDPAIKAELDPKLRAMNDWPTAKIEEEKRSLAARGREVIPALIELIDNDDEFAAKYACEILRELTGVDKGQIMNTTREDRKAISSDWKSWFLANASSYDAAKARNEEQILDLGIKWAREFKKASFPEAEEAVVRQIIAEGDKDIVSGLIMTVGWEDKVIAARAHDCLLRLTGQEMGLCPETDDGRKEMAVKWDAWWKSNRASWQFPSR